MLCVMERMKGREGKKGDEMETVIGDGGGWLVLKGLEVANV